MSAAIDQLTEKEKQALRLIVRGHDAKSAANTLELSVHTINDRLRYARRKLDVTSSREAARLLFESEAEPHDNPVHEGLGSANSGTSAQVSSASGGAHAGSAREARTLAPWITGVLIMSMLIAAVAAALVTITAQPQTEWVQEPSQTVLKSDAEIEAAASRWLALVDDSDWQASYDEAGASFREPNTVESWRAASQQARVPLGEVLSREVIAVQHIASPEQYRVVQFRTDFANREGAIESVTLERENGALRVMGYVID